MQAFWRDKSMAAVFGACIGLALQAGCGHTQWHYSALQDVNISLPAAAGAEPSVKRAGMPVERLHLQPGGQHTVLVAVQSHNNPDRESSEWSRAFVVVLDGPPAKGKVAVSPENGRLVTTSERRPARRPYVGLEGYVNILSVEGPKVKTYCVLRNELIDAYDESVVLRGFYEFRVGAGNEPFLRASGLAVGE
jgi:hypothetical protein